MLIKKITIMQFVVVRSITGNIRKLWAHCYTMGIWDDIAHVIVHFKCIILSSTTKEMGNLIGGGSCQKYIFYYKKPVSEPLSHAILISRRKHAYTTTRKTHLGHSLFLLTWTNAPGCVYLEEIAVQNYHSTGQFPHTLAKSPLEHRNRLGEIPTFDTQ